MPGFVQLAEPPLVSSAGRSGGTWVCKELVYAYAMWISPRFHIQVIRAYDSMQRPDPHPGPAFAPVKASPEARAAVSRPGPSK